MAGEGPFIDDDRGIETLSTDESDESLQKGVFGTDRSSSVGDHWDGTRPIATRLEATGRSIPARWRPPRRRVLLERYQDQDQTPALGQTWTALNGTGNNTLPPVQVSCVSFHPITPDWIYAGTDIGLFASEDMGQNWNVTSRFGVNEGPVFTEIADLIWHSYSTLIAVTHGRGMYECMPLPVVWVDLNYTGEEDGTIAHPWNTFAEAEGAIGNGAMMILHGGDYQEGSRVVRKRIELKGSEGTIIIR